MSNLDNQVVIYDRYPAIRELTFEEVYEAFLTGQIIRGFYVTEVTIGITAGEGLTGFDSLTIVHATKGTKIYMNKQGDWQVEE